MINLRSRIAKAREHRTQIRLRSSIDRAAISKLSKEFNRVAKDIINSNEGAVVATHEKNVYRILTNMYKDVFTTFGARALARLKPSTAKSIDELAIEYKAAIENQFADLVNKFSKKWTLRNASNIAKTTIGKARKIIADGTIEGLGEKEIAKKLISHIGGASAKYRARTIPRTETHAASQDASFEVAQSTGVDFVKEWVAITDARARETHTEINGTQIPMHERFQVGDDELLYPGDPSGSPEEIINCRCVCVYNPV